MIELLFLGSAAFAGGAHAVRQSRPTGQSGRRPQRDSLLVKAWNSSGAPRTDESFLADALADLGGRAVGSTVRRVAPRVQRRGQATRRRAESRWQRRRNEDRTVTFFRRDKPGTDPDGTDAPALGPGTPPPSAGGPVPPRPGPRGGAYRTPPPPPRPSAPPPGAPGPIPAPPAPGPYESSTGRRPPTGRGQGPWASARHSSGRRARPRMRMGVPLNLDAPGTDVEFLAACADLQQMLRGLGVAIQDWTEELAVRRLPATVIGPLDTVSDDLVDAAACTTVATVLFDDWFSEAREIAAAGIEFTGEDPE